MKDYIVRATAANAQIRAFAASTTELVEEARTRHNTSPVATAALGRLLTAGAMMADITAGVRSLHMIKRFSGLIANILKYGSLAGSIENLHSTADGKYRFCRRQNQLHQADLKQIQCDIGVSDAFSGFLAK